MKKMRMKAGNLRKKWMLIHPFPFWMRQESQLRIHKVQLIHPVQQCQHYISRNQFKMMKKTVGIFLIFNLLLCWECHKSQPAQYVQIGSAIHFLYHAATSLVQCVLLNWRSGVVSATSAESRLHQLQNSFIRLSVDVKKKLTEFQLFRLNNVKQIEFNCGWNIQAKFTLIYCWGCTNILDSQSLKFRFEERKKL